MWETWVVSLGRSPGEGNGNPLQYSCLENPLDGGAWWATVHGLQELDTTSLSLSLSWCDEGGQGLWFVHFFNMGSKFHYIILSKLFFLHSVVNLCQKSDVQNMCETGVEPSFTLFYTYQHCIYIPLS